MKNFDKALEAVTNGTGNVLICGGESSGKSKVLEMIAAYTLGSQDIFVMMNSQKLKQMVWTRPDSTYIYKSKGAKINPQIQTPISQDIVFIDEYDCLEELKKTTKGKRVIMTYTTENSKDLPQEYKDFFQKAVLCEVDVLTKDRQVSEVINI